MRTEHKKNAPLVGQFNTLGQSDTNKSGKRTVTVGGKGAAIDEVNVLEGRSKRKIITNAIILHLIDHAKSKGHDKMVQCYWNTYHCLNKVYTADNKLYGKYCKNRFCTLCTSIRKAELINKYISTIQQWEDPHFLTLTIRSKKARSLDKWMSGMVRAFDLINNRCKARHRRGKGIKIMGIKSLECNFNPKKQWYNPHYHMIVPNRAVGELLRDEWLRQWKGCAGWKGQDLRRVDDLESSLVEIMKYSTKIFTEIDVREERRQKGDYKVYIAAMHNIFKAMKPHQTFGSFGFKLPTEVTTREAIVNVLEDYKTWVFDPKESVYINTETDEVLFDYQLPEKIRRILESRVDLGLE